MKFKKLIQLFTLAFASISLASCNLFQNGNRQDIGGDIPNTDNDPMIPDTPTPDTPTPDLPEDVEIEQITINNYTYIATDFKVGEERTMEIETFPKVDVLKAIKAGKINCWSSNENVAKIYGNKIKALNPGYTDIKVDALNGAYATFGLNITGVKSIAIIHKDLLTKTWYLGTPSRQLTLSITPAPSCTLESLIQDGTLKITSSDESIIDSNTLTLRPKKAGTVTIDVYYLGLFDSVTLTIEEYPVPDPISISQLKIDAYEELKANEPHKTQTVYAVKGIVVATDTKSGSVIYDGKNYISAWGMYNEKENSVGQVVTAYGEVSLYYNMIEFNRGGYIFENIIQELPSDTALVDSYLFAYRDSLINYDINTQTLDSIFEPGYHFLTGRYVGEDIIETANKNRIRINRHPSTLNDTYSSLNIGDLIEVTGSLFGYNEPKQYFNFITNSIKIIEKAIFPESITLASNLNLNIFDTIDLNDYITLTPSNSMAIIDYVIKSNDNIVDIRDSKITAKESGDFIICPIAKNNTINIIGNEVQIHITNVINESSIYFNAPTISLSDLAKGSIVNQNKLFKSKMIITSESDNQYGAIRVKDPVTFEEISLYGLSDNLNDFSLVDSKIIFSNPANFSYISNKHQLKIGDELIVYAALANKLGDNRALINAVLIEKV